MLLKTLLLFFILTTAHAQVFQTAGKTKITGASNQYVADVDLLPDLSQALVVDVRRIPSNPGSGISQSDNTNFVFGITELVPTGGVFNDSITDITSGKAGAVRSTAKRALHINVRDNSGNEVLLATAANQVLGTAQLTAINANTDTLETLLASTNTKLDTSNTQLTAINGNTDGLEALVTSTNTKLDTSNTQLTAINGNTDGLETLVTASNVQLTAINANTDTLETLIGTSNTQLTAINGNTDGLETLVTSTNAKLDTANSNLSTINTSTSGITTTLTETNLRLGDETETTAASDAATSGLNGLVKRLLSRVTTLINFYAAGFGADASGIRVNAQVGNTTGAASFGAGATGAQTLRTATNLYDGSANALTSTAINATRSLDVNVTQTADALGNIQRYNAVDSNNSTMANLAISGVFVGPFTDAIQWSNVTIGVVSNQNSATNGLQIEWSADGVTVQDTDNYTVLAGSGHQYSFGRKWRYIRVRYTNGAVATTAFAIQTLLHAQTPIASTHRIADNVDAQHDGQLVISAPARVSLTASTPSSVSAGTSSALALAANTSRKGLRMVNNSVNLVYIGIGTTAILGAGMVLYPGGVWNMDEMDFTTAAINLIASAAASSVTIQEFSLP